MQKTLRSVITATLLLAAATTSQAASVEELEKQVEELAGQVRAIKAAGGGSAASHGAKDEGAVKKALEQTRFGGYGEFDYIFKRENGNGKGGNTFDPHRFVLYVNSPLADWVTLNAELEWEHGGDSSKKGTTGSNGSGEVAVEQAFLDFTIARPFNIKAGVLLAPVGAINLYHEPTNFNSTERPELDRFLIPGTWREMGAGIHGALGSKVNYELLVMNGLDGSKFSTKEGIRGGRQDMDRDVNRNKAVAGRLEIRPATNLYTNFSFYTGNSAKVGTAYTTVAAFDGRYSIGNFDIAGEYVHIYQDNPGSLGVADIGNRMSGYWVEGAWHVMPKSLKKGKLAESDAVLFARYSEIDTQQGNVKAGASGLYDRNYTTFGVVFKPVTTVAIKADYQIYDDHRGAGEIPLDNDKFQLTVGFVF
jgi:hypothetical protein